MLPSYYEIETAARRLRSEQRGRLMGTAITSVAGFFSRWFGVIAGSIQAGRRRAM